MAENYAIRNDASLFRCGMERRQDFTRSNVSVDLLKIEQASKAYPGVFLVKSGLKLRINNFSMDFEVRGLCAAPYTPFLDDAKRGVDHAGIDEHVKALIGQGVHFAFVNGTTGEGATMSVCERKDALASWLKASQAHARGEMSIIAHVGAESIADTLELAAHAEAIAVPAIAIICPTFNKPSGISAIIELLEAVAAVAPTRPLYYYHIAIRTGVAIRCDALLEAVHGLRGAGRLATFRGIKYRSAARRALAPDICSL